ncbi:MAG: spore germination protein GerW family protein [Acutalibacteraceae bacterium]
MVDVDSVIGKPITTPDGTTVIPISKVSYGFASGGSDFPAKISRQRFLRRWRRRGYYHYSIAFYLFATVM